MDIEPGGRVESTQHAPTSVMRVLETQLGIVWSLGADHLLPAVGLVDAYWEPSGNTCSVRRGRAGTWRAEMPDESVEPLPTVTIAWLLWHLTWWWGNAHRWSDGRNSLAPDDVLWPGSAGQAVAEVVRLHDSWADVLVRGEPQASTSAPFAAGKTLAGLAAWVNFELTKNLAEIGVLVTLQRNLA